MYTPLQLKENKSRAVAHLVSQQKNKVKQDVGHVRDRHKTTLSDRANNEHLTVNKNVVQRGNGFQYGGGEQVKESIANFNELMVEVENTLDQTYEGADGLFLKNSVTTSVQQWAQMIYEYMESKYNFGGMGLADVLTAINRIKDENRERVLLKYAKNVVYSAGETPYSVDNLKDLLKANNVYLDDADDNVLQTIYDTGGEFSKTKVTLENGNIELSDDDNIVVIMEPHQNKHQNPQLPEFVPYTGEGGSQFAADKDLNWHINNINETVRLTIRNAIENELVTTNGNIYMPPKNAIDGIIYDLAISYDEDTGKYVGTYHCNPVVAEQ